MRHVTPDRGMHHWGRHEEPNGMDRLDAHLRQELNGMLGGLPRRVTLKLFTRDGVAECPGCGDARELLEELAGASGGTVQFDVHDLDREPELAARLDVTTVPVIAVLGGDEQQDYGIRFYGAPDGYEFATLVEDIRLVSRGDADLMPATRDVLAHLRSPLHIQVFVTPTCPYCPRAAILAHSLALASDQVTADVVDASEFPVLANAFHVRGVPKTVVNGSVHIDGAVPESVLLAQLAPLLEASLG